MPDQAPRVNIGRMRSAPRLLVLAASLTALGCATTPIPIRIFGNPNAMMQLAGNWSGTYTMHGSSRTGAISFSLRATDTAAFGDVLMLPMVDEKHTVWTERQNHPDGVVSHPSILTIAFVGVWSDGVSGMLDPYTDTDCRCQVLTTFTGRLTSATTLEGTFVTRVPGTTVTRGGVWFVRRARAAIQREHDGQPR